VYLGWLFILIKVVMLPFKKKKFMTQLNKLGEKYPTENMKRIRENKRK